MKRLVKVASAARAVIHRCVVHLSRDIEMYIDCGNLMLTSSQCIWPSNTNVGIGMAEDRDGG